MKKIYQTRFSEKNQRGNCYAAVIASIMELDSAEDVIQIQEHYEHISWVTKLDDWIEERGYELMTIRNHLYNDEYYFVSGQSPRSSKIHHICIFKNGEMVHDPHPDGTGILNHMNFSQLSKK